MNELVKLVTIKSVIPMKNKDRIVCVKFNEIAYSAIMGKTDAIVDSKVYFIREGSIVPNRPEFNLKKSSFSEKYNGYIIKPMVMGETESGEKVKSWGIVLTPQELGVDPDANVDVEKLFNIRKYETIDQIEPKKENKFKKILKKLKLGFLLKFYYSLSKASSGDFPTEIISKSDEANLGLYPDIWNQALKENSEVVVTAKMEGQSVTCFLNNKNKLIVCSRNRAYYKDNGSIYFQVAKRYKIREQLINYKHKFGVDLVIQAEQVGPGIQNNIYCLSDNEWFVFNMRDKKRNRQLEFLEMQNTCNFIGLKTVPLLFKGNISQISNIEEYVEEKYWTIDKYGCNWNYHPFYNEHLYVDYFPHEGVVIRSKIYDKDKNIGFSLKVKSMNYSTQSLGYIFDKASKRKLDILDNINDK